MTDRPTPRDRELQALQTIVEVLQPMPLAARARVLLAAAVLIAPGALTEPPKGKP